MLPSSRTAPRAPSPVMSRRDPRDGSARPRRGATRSSTPTLKARGAGRGIKGQGPRRCRARQARCARLRGLGTHDAPCRRSCEEVLQGRPSPPLQAVGARTRPVVPVRLVRRPGGPWGKDLVVLCLARLVALSRGAGRQRQDDADAHLLHRPMSSPLWRGAHLRLERQRAHGDDRHRRPHPGASSRAREDGTALWAFRRQLCRGGPGVQRWLGGDRACRRGRSRPDRCEPVTCLLVVLRARRCLRGLLL